MVLFHLRGTPLQQISGRDSSFSSLLFPYILGQLLSGVGPANSFWAWGKQCSLSLGQSHQVTITHFLKVFDHFTMSFCIFFSPQIFSAVKRLWNILCLQHTSQDKTCPSKRSFQTLTSYSSPSDFHASSFSNYSDNTKLPGKHTSQ